MPLPWGKRSFNFNNKSLFSYTFVKHSEKQGWEWGKRYSFALVGCFNDTNRKTVLNKILHFSCAIVNNFRDKKICKF